MGTKIDPPGPRGLEVDDAEGGDNQQEDAEEEEQTPIETPLEDNTSADQPAEGDSTGPDGKEQGPKLTPQGKFNFLIIPSSTNTHIYIQRSLHCFEQR
jgi:hypothetical protein